MITFSIGIAPAGSSAGTWNPGNNQSRRRKTPSDPRRDERRKSEFIAKKTMESNESSVKAKLIDPVKVVLVQPKDEIELVGPELKDGKKVNYVGEYIYDTKLKNDEIHKPIWKTLQNNFKEGVEEFSDGSTYNEKIIMFWEKCKFKEGFERNYILDKKNWPNGMKKIEIEEPG